MNLKAKVVYKNRNLKTISECEYNLKDYTDMLSMDLKRIISDVEDLVYSMTGSKSKEDWNESDILAFNRIKHKILDKAGEIERLPVNIFDGDNDAGSISSFWDSLFNTRGE